MNNLHCTSCGTPLVQVTYDEWTVERMLNRLKKFPYRYQLCKMRYRAFLVGLNQREVRSGS